MASPRPRLDVVLFIAGLSLAARDAAASTFPRAGFTFSPPNPSVTTTVQFHDTSTGPPTSWFWDFGDPGSGGDDTSTDQNPTHIFSSTGNHNVTLTATNSSGSSMATHTLNILPPQVPDASFTFVADKLRVTFADTSTNNPTAWLWNFGDGASGSNSSTLQNPTHTFSTEGTYTVSLIATNVAGDSPRAFRTLTVLRTVQVPVASFSYSVNDLVVDFTDTSVNSPNAWSWDFGDPGSGADDTSDAQNPTHTFSKSGTFTVTLVSSNAAGSSVAVSRQVAVGQLPTQIPVASFTFAADGLTVTFTDTSTNVPMTWSWDFGDPASGGANSSTAANPTHVFSAAGTFTVTLVASNAFGPSQPFALAVTVSPCVSDPTTLCLNAGRFKVSVTWSVPNQNRNGIGTAVTLTDDTGYFWFFTPTNVELVIKVLDARAVNGFFWVFYGALSDVEYTITVFDTVTGAVKIYHNASGNLASFADTSAFSPSGVEPTAAAGSAASVAERSAEELYGIYAALTATETRPPDALEACSTGGTILCLNQNRFRITVDWQVPDQNRSGSGQAVPISSDTGYFWFFSSANVEVVIKVLDAHTVNGHFWVFYGALSNVQYTITVTDTQTNSVRVYPNPSGTLASHADTSAF